MAKKKKESRDLIRIGHYAFIAGIVIALIVGLIPQLSGDISVWIMVVLGIIVGLINILIAAVAFIIASSSVAVTLGNAILYVITGILVNMIVFIAPVTIIVSIMAVIRLAQKR